MNPINASLAGTSVAPRSPRAPRSPMVQSKFSPSEKRSYQLSLSAYSKAENGQLTSATANKKSRQQKADKDDRASSNAMQSSKKSKKNVKRCLLM